MLNTFDIRQFFPASCIIDLNSPKVIPDTINYGTIRYRTFLRMSSQIPCFLRFITVQPRQSIEKEKGERRK